MIRVSIVGITGYTGEELLKILSQHPGVKISGLYGRASGETRDLESVYPHFKNLNLKIEPLNAAKIKETSDVVFLALPHAVAFEAVPSLLDAGVRVIDLSADFRLKSFETYEKWYNVSHTAKNYIPQAVYGISELKTEEIKNASLIANPGCYPTTILLGTAPAAKNGFITFDGVAIDSKSGISGAGRKAAKEYFDKEHPNFRAYKIAGSHRHIPEIEQELSLLSGENVIVSFTPHIMPVERGMLSTIYAKLKKQMPAQEILEAYKKFYDGKPFVKILEDGALPSVKDVANTNFCEISIKADERAGKLIIISAIDNLVKGASGQAVQNMNLMFGLPETQGLLQDAK